MNLVEENNQTVALERASLAVRWITDNLEYFDPWQANELSMEGVQALAELTIVYTRLTKNDRLWSELDMDGTIRPKWLAHLEHKLRLPAVAELSRKRPVQSFPYILPYLTLRSIGWKDAFYEKTLEMLDEWGFPDAQEVVPFRELDVVYFYNISGYGEKRLFADSYERTFLSKMKNAVYIDNDSAYSITHTILYLSDFGLEYPMLLEPRKELVQSTIESLIVHYWRLGNWDILGELLLCAEIMGVSESSICPIATERFYSFHQTDGSINGRKDLSEDLIEASLNDDKKAIFSLCYHTTIVSLLLSLQIISKSHEKNN
ncbi:DUF6895 family protein [Olivibacter sitiensis]|uniref:DUF6895 family protein n=1 Tax=Olivibacter sitiensis TaxID=376470 RepID=UPI0004004D45|nr:hypothetical protein [Olivibacter sitiensis]